MTLQIITVLVSLLAMIIALIMDKMRPGMVLFSVIVVFMCMGIISPAEMLEGFSNKGMITIAMLFLVSEGVRRSGALSKVIKKLLPQRKTTVFRSMLSMLPTIAFISAFLNNTPVVVIFAPIIKRWANYFKTPATYYLIPLSYATILGGICTLIGTSTNLVVHSMMQDVGLPGFGMFELGKVGIFIALTGIIYLFIFAKHLLPNERPDSPSDENEEDAPFQPTEVVIGARFPGINRKIKDFDFQRHYGAEIKELRRSGNIYTNFKEMRFRENDTLVVIADNTFIKAWGESTVFIIISNKEDSEPIGKKRRWFAIIMLLIMIIGATIGEMPGIQRLMPEDIKLDMFFFVAVTTVLMAWTRMFPARKYTKFISWDILITIACAFGISKAMSNSGFADMLASFIINLSHSYGPYVLLAVMFVITNIFTELITNNAAAALSFPIALSISQQLGASPMPFFVVICMAASASFCTPIGYQTNLIVQGIGNYKFTDFLRIGLPLNIITFLISIFVIPQIWPF